MDAPPGARPGPRRRSQIDWELVACGLRGHTLLGTQAETVGDDDAHLVRERPGVRWHRCLRCDSWVALPPPDPAADAGVPSREAIEVPLRGRALRDRVILRVIAVDRALHFLILVALGIAVLLFAAHERSLRGSFYRVLTALQGGVAGGPVQSSGHVGILHTLDHLFTLRGGTLQEVGFGLIAYGVLEGVEAVGLWRGRRWAEYLTFLATTILLPLEVHELTVKVSPLKLIGFVINLAVAVYLLYAKRLFGLRGGGEVDERERAAGMSWETIEAATPPLTP